MTDVTDVKGVKGVTAVTDVVLRLTARDLLPDDLESCGWSGSPLHMENVAGQLERARLGEVDYLAVCPPSDIPVAIGGIDYRVREGAGTLWQLSVHPALQSCGIGTFLIAAAERRIAARGLRRAELGVEEDNPRARALYERLGYVAYGREPDSWNEQAPDGSVRRHETMCTQMARDLDGPPAAARAAALRSEA
ncbi:GNAT family N-acetyltransferase [Streptomyces sp. NPDC058221]|uniref:GNAT family N-acetyltransferase n=1 Tax=Streptomyces sp. NPDC058221 TaxID=3346388 RepID=UPI0036E93AC2